MNKATKKGAVASLIQPGESRAFFCYGCESALRIELGVPGKSQPQIEVKFCPFCGAEELEAL